MHAVLLGHSDLFGRRVRAEQLKEAVAKFSPFAWCDIASRLAASLRFHSDLATAVTGAENAILTATQQRRILAARSREPDVYQFTLGHGTPMLLAKAGLSWGDETRGTAGFRLEAPPTELGLVILAMNDRLNDCMAASIGTGSREDDLASSLVLSARIHHVPGGGNPGHLCRFSELVSRYDTAPGKTLLSLYEEATGRPWQFDSLMAMLAYQKTLDTLQKQGPGHPVGIDVPAASVFLPQQEWIAGWLDDYAAGPSRFRQLLTETGADPDQSDFIVDLGPLGRRTLFHANERNWLPIDTTRLLDSVTWGIREIVDTSRVGQRLGPALEKFVRAVVGAGIETPVEPWIDPGGPGRAETEVADAVLVQDRELVVVQIKGRRSATRAADSAVERFNRTVLDAVRQHEKHLTNFRDGVYSPPPGCPSWERAERVWPLIVSFDHVPDAYHIRRTVREACETVAPILGDDRVGPIDFLDLHDLEVLCSRPSGMTPIDLLNARRNDARHADLSVTGYANDRLGGQGSDAFYQGMATRLFAGWADFLTEEKREDLLSRLAED